MALTERSIDTAARHVTLEQELETLQRMVAEARRARWHGEKVVIEPDFENFLATLDDPAPAPDLGPAWQRENHRNAWADGRRAG